MWLQRNTNTAVVAIIGLYIQQLCGGSSHWLEDTTNSNRQKYFRWVGILFQGVFFPVLLTY